MTDILYLCKACAVEEGKAFSELLQPFLPRPTTPPLINGSLIAY